MHGIATNNAIQSLIVRDGYLYWLAKRNEGRLPSRGDFDPPFDVPSLAKFMMLKDVRRDPLDFRYRFVGTAVRPHMTADWTGKWMSEISFQRSPSMIWDYHQHVAETGEAMLIRPEYVGPLADYLFVEAALLPLATDHDVVDKIMIFIDFIRRAEAHRSSALSVHHGPSIHHA
jgi:hypothetical protein